MGFCLLVFAAVAASTPDGVLAYIEEQPGGGRVVMSADLRSGAVRVLGKGPDDGAPHWSPGGDALAFEYATSTKRAIALVGADGQGFEVVSDVPGACYSPAWSPEGRRVAYSHSDPEALDTPGTGQRLRVYNRETGKSEAWGGAQAVFLQPRWLPNARFGALLRDVAELPGIDVGRLLRELDTEGALCCIFLRRQDGRLTAEPALVTRSEALPLSMLDTRGGYSYVATSVSAHASGSRLAFDSNDGGDREIFVLAEQRLIDVSNHRAADWNPVWAPKARQIAFESFRGGMRGVYHVYADTARVSAIDASPDYAAWSPAWSPDGRRIAYVSDKSGKPDLFIGGVDGGGSLAIPTAPGAAAPARLAPAWRPESE